MAECSMSPKSLRRDELSSSLRLGHVLTMPLYFGLHCLRPTRQPKDKIDDRVALLYTNLRLADPNFYKNIDINVVLGADVYARLIKPNIQPESVGSPLAQDTVLGWIIIGKFGI
ncbi:hypothetical protein CVS40_11675 [Lucilia cuprina]|nr:hypothetical protein CVS40_11675 [Lucilia cuprina]